MDHWQDNKPARPAITSTQKQKLVLYSICLSLSITPKCCFVQDSISDTQPMIMYLWTCMKWIQNEGWVWKYAWCCAGNWFSLSRGSLHENDKCLISWPLECDVFHATDTQTTTNIRSQWIKPSVYFHNTKTLRPPKRKEGCIVAIPVQTF